jgi:O-antigen/teichoic acid export membrane protein
MNKKKEGSISSVLIWQMISRFLLQGLGFLTAPIFTRLLTPSDYGYVTVYTTWVTLCSLVVGLQTYGSIANAKIKYGIDKIDSYLSSVITLSVISFVMVLSLSIVFKKQLSNLLKLSGDLVLLLVIQSFASFCITFHTTKLIQFKKAAASTILSFVVSLCSTILAILFLFLSHEKKYSAKIYGTAIPTIIIGFVVLGYIYFKGQKAYNKKYWKYCFILTFPLIFHGAGHLILAQSDKIMLQRIAGERITGIYGFCYNFATIIQVIWGAFNVSWIPFYYEYKKNNQNDIIIDKSKNYIVFFTTIVMGFILLLPEFYKIMSPVEYWTGISLMPPIILSFYLNFLYGFPVNFEFFHEKTRLITLGTLSASVINIILNIIFIPRYGSFGAAISTLISYVFLFIFHEIIVRYFIKGYEYKLTIYLTGLIPICLTIFIFYFFQNYWIIRWGIGGFLGLFLLQKAIKNKGVF